MTAGFSQTAGRAVLLDFDELSRPGDGPLREASILFLHGFGGDKTQLRLVATRLSTLGARCILPSLRGHGDSLKPEFGYSCLDFAADLHRLIACLGTGWHVVGYSHGALVGAIAAVSLGPAIRSLVSIDESFAAHPERMIHDAHAEARSLRWHFGWQHLLTGLSVPCLFLIARDSHMVAAEEHRYLGAAAGPNLQVEYLAGTHASCLEDETLDRHICRFYQSQLPAGRPDRH
jgi:pimeloyl-ACP methyl ester carboxylesterase